MSTCGRRLTVTLAAALGALALAAPAGADPQDIGIGTARLDPSERGTFSVPAWTDAAGAHLTTVAATILDGGTAVTTVALSDADGDGQWAPDAPLSLSSDGGVMPHLGRYTISTTAVDSAGNSATNPADGTLDFTLRPRFGTDVVNGQSVAAHVVSPATAAHQAVAVTGRLEGVRPGTTATQPVTAGSVSVEQYRLDGTNSSHPAGSLTAPVGPGGTFTTAEFPQPGAYYVARYTPDAAATDVDGSATSNADGLMQVTTVAITATANHARLNEGQPLTITGTARLPGGSPAAGLTVDLSLGSYGSGPQKRVLTNSAGAFRGSILAVASSNPYTRWTADVEGNYYFGSVAQDVTVPAPARLRGVSITLAGNGRINARATLSLMYPYGVDYGVGPVCVLEYARAPSAKWVVLAKARIDESGLTVSAAAPHDDGYYRLYHPESDQLAEVASVPVRLHRLGTFMFDNTAASAHVRKGTPVRITGTLKEYRNRRWLPLAHRKVYLYFRAKGSSRWYYYAVGQTDAKGRAALASPAVRTGYWLLQYFGDPAHFDSEGRAQLVTVS